jgi:hypothetical protein
MFGLGHSHDLHGEGEHDPCSNYGHSHNNRSHNHSHGPCDHSHHSPSKFSNCSKGQHKSEKIKSLTGFDFKKDFIELDEINNRNCENGHRESIPTLIPETDSSRENSDFKNEKPMRKTEVLKKDHPYIGLDIFKERQFKTTVVKPKKTSNTISFTKDTSIGQPTQREGFKCI